MQVIRWQDVNPPQEQQLRKKMQQDGLAPYAWSNGPSEQYAVHSHTYQKVLYCVQGSIRFVLPDVLDASSSATVVDLRPGDCMLLPSGVRHSAFVGPQGVTCLEAPQYL